MSPQSEISRLNEEKERSKRRRDENKKQKLANQPAPEPINILVANQYINIYEMTVIQIKDYLKEKKVNTSGKKSVIAHTTEEENPITKLRSCMLKTVAGKRDLGQCEVSTLLRTALSFFF